MLKKWMFILAFSLIAYPMIAQENQGNETSSECGRYQLSAVGDKICVNARLFLLDTKTGEVWMNKNPWVGGSWIPLPLPHHAYPPFPQVAD